MLALQTASQSQMAICGMQCSFEFIMLSNDQPWGVLLVCETSNMKFMM